MFTFTSTNCMLFHSTFILNMHIYRKNMKSQKMQTKFQNLGLLFSTTVGGIHINK